MFLLRKQWVIFTLVLLQLSQSVFSSEQSEQGEKSQIQPGLLSRLTSGVRFLPGSIGPRINRTTPALIPEPHGPFYGLTVKTKNAARLPIPLSAAGSCEKGAIYTIRNAEDLRKYEGELQCIFSAASAPSKIPEGAYAGKILLVLNSSPAFFNPLINLIWRGNFVYKAECQANSTEIKHIGIHNVFGQALAPYFICIEPLKENFSPGEHEDGKASVIQDFTQDFSKACPNYANFVATNGSDLPTQIKRLTNIYPVTQALDVMRLVGRQPDGGAILLGKTYLRDHYRSDKQAATAAFWYAVSYDKELSPEFADGQALPPLEEGFRYTFPGLVDLIKRISPVDNFLSRPFANLFKLLQGVFTTVRSTFSFIRELISNYGSLQANSMRFNDVFRDAKPKGNQPSTFNV